MVGFALSHTSSSRSCRPSSEAARWRVSSVPLPLSGSRMRSIWARLVCISSARRFFVMLFHLLSELPGDHLLDRGGRDLLASAFLFEEIVERRAPVRIFGAVGHLRPSNLSLRAKRSNLVPMVHDGNEIASSLRSSQ